MALNDRILKIIILKRLGFRVLETALRNNTTLKATFKDKMRIKGK